MYDLHAHTQHLNTLEASVRDARQRSPELPRAAVRVISIMAVLVIAGTVVGTMIA